MSDTKAPELHGGFVAYQDLETGEILHRPPTAEELKAIEEEKQHAANSERWSMIATFIGYNELAKTGRSLGEKVYFRLFREKVGEMLIAAGHEGVIAKADVLLELPQPPHIKFQASDLELMREVVQAHDAGNQEAVPNRKALECLICMDRGRVWEGTDGETKPCPDCAVWGVWLNPKASKPYEGPFTRARAERAAEEWRNEHGWSASVRRLTDGPPECPGPDCKACNGEACDLCGAGETTDPSRPRCEHDVSQRHTRPTTGEPT